ncbi:MAG: histidine--tRNA ligase [Bacteroidetes bacterium]|nr:histidine--tRNA ligase [Bacteroidota bacterium]MCW5893990.1 histidine--tRNA ligase [Bacteroidota bacterium]
MSEQQIVEPRLLRGFRDYLPAQMNARVKMIAAIRNVYERYGFQPLDTPAQEYRVTLTGYGEENTKQIFSFLNPEEEDVALRFDLTVPLARVVAQYPDLVLPFRRYQVAPVWRADKPDPGRFREFIQFDLDAVGTSSLAADAEILCAMHDTLKALGIDRFKVRFSDRKVLDSLLDFAGITHDLAHSVFRILDKLEKIGIDGVAAELTKGRIDSSGDKIPGLGLSGNQVDRIKEFIVVPKGKRREVLASLESLFKNVESAKEAVEELRFICDSLDALAISEDHVQLDLSIARGLDYYTGPVFEASLDDAPEFGSVFGGGRYDGLVERFLGRKIPAVGASIGVDRLLAAMEKLGLLQFAPSTAKVIVTVMEPSRLTEYQKLTRELREAGINTEMYLGEEKSLGKQLQYANRQQIPLAVIIGSDEFAKGEVTVKNLKLGGELQDKKKTAQGKERDEWLKLSRTVQATVPLAETVQHIKNTLETI